MVPWVMEPLEEHSLIQPTKGSCGCWQSWIGGWGVERGPLGRRRKQGRWRCLGGGEGGPAGSVPLHPSPAQGSVMPVGAEPQEVVASEMLWVTGDNELKQQRGHWLLEWGSVRVQRQAGCWYPCPSQVVPSWLQRACQTQPELCLPSQHWARTWGVWGVSWLDQRGTQTQS